MAPYRTQASPSGGIAALRARLAAVEAKVTEHFWKAVPDAAQGELAELRRACADLSGEAAIEAHVRLVALVESLVERLPAIEETWNAPPSDAPREVLGPSGSYTSQPRHTLGIARKIDPAAAPMPDVRADAGVVCLSPRGCPLALRVLAFEDGSAFVALATSVSRATARVEVKLGGALDDLKAALGLLQDTEIGDDEIDALFEIRGEASHARALIGPPVRSALRMLAGLGEVALAIGDGRAAFTSKGMAPSQREIERAAHARAWIRAAPPTLQLRV